MTNTTTALFVSFVDGKVTRYKMGDKLSGVFEALKDRQIFRDKLTILNGAAAWDLTGKRDETQCLDLDPWVLYNAEDVTEEFM
ncbi:MAG: DUF2442 domain-containing protein [Bacillota bacterium]|uniref:DUF2442 domain-containing protein n=1 Tax=Desulfurispora thermophila TaxID=265470 RepID=UPI000A06C9F9|nr:DUF2442 domain-containing protein [Desulfurispora thermophila]